MARHYHIDIAAYVARADHKWVDNLLSHAHVPGVDTTRQGVARRISVSGVQHIALVRHLVTELSLPADRALRIASALLRSDTGSAELSEVLSLRFDHAAFRRQIDHRLAEAVESIVPARRGRPPAK